MFTLRENMLIFAKGTRYFKLESVLCYQLRLILQQVQGVGRGQSVFGSFNPDYS